MKKNPQLAQDLYKVVGLIQASKRTSVADEIGRLAAAVGSTDDLLADRRSTTWAPGGKARATVETRTFIKKANLRVTWRNGGSVVCNIDEAAQFIKKSVGSLRCYLSKGQGRHVCVVEDGYEEDIVTVERV